MDKKQDGGPTGKACYGNLPSSVDASACQAKKGIWTKISTDDTALSYKQEDNTDDVPLDMTTSTDSSQYVCQQQYSFDTATKKFTLQAK